MVSGKDLELAQVSVIGSLLLEPELIGEVLLRLPDRDFLSGTCRRTQGGVAAFENHGRTWAAYRDRPKAPAR